MKTILFLSLFISTICFSQVSDRWKHYVENVNKNMNQLYYLTTIEKAYENKYSIVQKLDANYCIIRNESLITRASLKEVWPANDLWKLPSNFSNHSEDKTYVLVPDNMASLLVDLKFISIPVVQIINDKWVVIKSNSEKIVSKIVPLSSLLSITEEMLIPQVESIIIDQNFTINNINKANYSFPSLTGENQVASIKDNLFDVEDVDLLDKFIPSTTYSSVVSSHASAMATIVSGLGNSSVLGKGVAPKAKLHSSNFLNIFPDEVFTLEGASTQNHSYGTVIENFYGSLANSYDAQLNSNSTLTHCFSSGNKGLEGYKSITGNFKQSKNSIVVGCIDSNEVIMPFSSKGPAYDGRIKPELVAYSMQGTSNATALITGVVTLMKQYYQNKYNTSLSNAQAKSILINSAKDLGNTGPDYTYGYGSVDANRCLKTINENKILSGNLSSGQTNFHSISIPVSAKNLKVTLVWNDLPANANSNISLMNDLDLEVVSTNTTVFLPWILNPNRPDQQAVTGKDRLNNVEQVVVKDPVPGNYNIAIIGAYISNATQDYSIAYEYELENQFEWNYPAANDNFPYDGKTFSPFKWHSSFSSVTGKLAITYDDGQNWETIGNDLNLEKEQYLFEPSEKKFSRAKLKMTIGAIDYMSESFVISYDLNIKNTLVCDGTTEIKWEKPVNVDLFNVYQLAGDSMQFKEQTSNSIYRYNDEKIYTIAPVIGNGEGVKSESTLKYAPNSNCYLEFAMAEVFENNKIKISASVLSLYNIKAVELIKVTGTSETVIGKISDLVEKSFYFMDVNPMKGSNKYKINIILENNNTITSQYVDVNYVGDDLFLIYPTLLSKNQELNIEGKKEEEVSFYMYNLRGQSVAFFSMTGISNTISIKDCSAGIYVYKIITRGGEVQTGKIIIF